MDGDEDTTVDVGADGPATDDDGLPQDTATDQSGADDLDQRLSGALERIGHVTRTMLSRQAYAEGVSALQLQLLLRLGSVAAGPRVSDLALELDVSQATVSDAMSTLRRKGLVAKEQDPGDRRNSVFSLTPEGDLLRTRLARWDRPLADKLVALSDADKGEVLRVVLGLVAGLQTDGVINVARTCMTCRFFDDTSHPDGPEPYRCNLLEVAFADTQLRVDCQEHQAPLTA
ncbi:winged helix-turn-helix transcriptional regulator [Nocardioides dongxiaopingii]|uniref:MarR family winged helix-turn-helix transcriptional regulator n=1 Tax=Nocardioides sp. S-1144 TaxID=2582905 RepID=UPI00110E3290|nr:MarR family winged helix-turn-helix transcriptional regulator [Nocardioides sp. S-1144]QCW49326.1 winged helix-turn-helix transcriptional regulator [Nocardioides sp. S-1144]